MKSLIVFYSLEGNTKLIADILAEELNSEVLELKPDKEISKKGFMKFFWGGKSVIFNEKPKLLNDIPNLNNYDTVFIGTPIWAGTYTPAINTFVTQNIIENKEIAFFACNSGGGAEKCFEKLRNIYYKNNKILKPVEFINPINVDKEELRKAIKTWISGLKN